MSKTLPNYCVCLEYLDLYAVNEVYIHLEYMDRLLKENNVEGDFDDEFSDVLLGLAVVISKIKNAASEDEINKEINNGISK